LQDEPGGTPVQLAMDLHLQFLALGAP
jgi:hypothetical protein